MGIGNHELIQHIETCDNCISIQNVIEQLEKKDRSDKIDNALTILFDLQMECYNNNL